jgi:heat-inducible transcriptional repressor
MTAMGLLEQPHTSAGRIPSPQGYRIYVNELMNEHRLSLEETQRINDALKQKMAKFDDLLADAGKLVSEMTSYPVYTAAAPSLSHVIRRYDLIRVDAGTVIAVVLLDDESAVNRVMRFPEGIDESLVKKMVTVFNASFTGIPPEQIDAALVQAAERSLGDESGAVAALAAFAVQAMTPAQPNRPQLVGASNILSLPEYRDVDKAQKLMDYLSDESVIRDMPQDGEGGVRILIGPENVAEELQDSGVVLASYDMGNDMRGVIGVVGPTRMDYAKVAAYLRGIAMGMQRAALAGMPQPPPQLTAGINEHGEKR